MFRRMTKNFSEFVKYNFQVQESQWITIRITQNNKDRNIKIELVNMKDHLKILKEYLENSHTHR